jgi:hypothetical protein
LVAVVVLGYASFPYAVSTKIDALRPGATVYVYGQVSSQRFALANISVFRVSDATGSVYVAWNGSLPAAGDRVLIHGVVEDVLGVMYIRADAVVVWYL